ncbi:hypothetical protein H8959_011042, partial [Pygathrix nigripes]
MNRAPLDYNPNQIDAAAVTGGGVGVERKWPERGAARTPAAPKLTPSHVSHQAGSPGNDAIGAVPLRRRHSWPACALSQTRPGKISCRTSATAVSCFSSYLLHFSSPCSGFSTFPYGPAPGTSRSGHAQHDEDGGVLAPPRRGPRRRRRARVRAVVGVAGAETRGGEQRTRWRRGIPAFALKVHIVGRRGDTRKKIEMETKTTISIPKPGEDGEIVITGQHRNGVISARTRIDVLLDTFRRKQPFTHFLAFFLNEVEVQEGFLRFQEEVLAKCSM